MLIVRKKDRVVVLGGKDRGKTGEVIRVIPKAQRVLVSKVNMVKRHKRPTQSEPGGIREIESPIPLSRIMLVCPKCEKPTRPRFEFLPDGKKERFCRNCREMII